MVRDIALVGCSWLVGGGEGGEGRMECLIWHSLGRVGCIEEGEGVFGETF